MENYFKVIKESQNRLGEIASLTEEEDGDIFSPILAEFHKVAAQAKREVLEGLKALSSKTDTYADFAEIIMQEIDRQLKELEK